MGLFGNLLGVVADSLSGSESDSDDLGCDWFCDDCGAYLNDQDDFTTASGRWMCDECGFENDVTEDNIVDDDDW